MPPVVPDSGNAVGIWIRIIERAVCDPQGFDFFTFWSEKLAHRCQGREPPKKNLRLCFGARCSVHAAAWLVIQFNASECSLNVSTDSIDPSGHSASITHLPLPCSITKKKGWDLLMPTLTSVVGLRQGVACVCLFFCWAAFNWLSRLFFDHIVRRCTSSDSCFACFLRRDNLRRTFTIAKITAKQTTMVSEVTQSTFRKIDMGCLRVASC